MQVKPTGSLFLRSDGPSLLLEEHSLGGPELHKCFFGQFMLLFLFLLWARGFSGILFPAFWMRFLFQGLSSDDMFPLFTVVACFPGTLGWVLMGLGPSSKGTCESHFISFSAESQLLADI